MCTSIYQVCEEDLLVKCKKSLTNDLWKCEYKSRTVSRRMTKTISDCEHSLIHVKDEFEAFECQ